MTMATNVALLGLFTGLLLGCGGNDNSNSDNELTVEPAPHPAPAAPALRQWSNVSALETQRATSSSPLVAADSAGNALALWIQETNARYALYAARYTSTTGQWSAEQVINNGDGTVDATPIYDDFLAAPRFQLALDAAGNAVAVWSQAKAGDTQLWFNTFSTETNAWGAAAPVIDQPNVPPQIPDPNAVPNPDPNVSPPLIDNPAYIAGAQHHPALALKSDGNGLVVWVQSYNNQHSIRAANYDAATQTWREHQLTLDDNILTEDYIHTRLFAYPQAVIDNQGNAVAVWIKRNNATGTPPSFDVLARRYMAADNATAALDQPLVWQAATALDAVNGEAAHIQLASDEAGNVLSIWSQYDNGRYRIFANQVSAGSTTWQTARLLDNAASGDAYAPRIAMNSSGNAIAWWQHANHIAEPVQTIATRRYTGAQGWATIDGAEPNIEFLPGFGSHPVLQLSPDNLALAVWNSGEGYTVYAQHNGADTWSPALQIAGLNDARDHALAQSANGRAFSVWTFEDERDLKSVYASVFE